MSPQNKQHGRVQAHKRAAAQAAARAAAQRRQRRLRAGVGGAIAIVVVLAVVLALFPNDGPDPAATTTTTTATTEPLTTTTTAPIVDETIPDDVSQNVSPPFIYGLADCAPATKPAEIPESFADAPKSCLTDGVDYRAVVETDHGSFTIDLFEKRAPGTVNNFVQLAKWGWFDGQSFHRVVPGFVNQTGDPKGDGTGGPGYAIADELPPAVTSYARWAVAMANSGPNTNGSQWFTCIDCRILPTPAYSIFGQVIEGTDVAQAINDLGTSDGPPSEPVLITSLTITEA